MENINMGGLKIDNMNGVNAVNASANAVQINAKAENTSKDMPKPAEATAQENSTETAKKHVVVYIGSSEFVDSTGHKWHKNDEKTYNDDEYGARNDLHFMVKYGEMKHTVVTM